jgi:hypothetical protein
MNLDGAGGLGGEGRRRDVELGRQPDHQRLRRLVQVREHRARVTQQGELHGEAEPAGVAETLGDKMPVGSRQGEEPRQRIGILGHAQQSPALFVGENLSALQGILRPQNAHYGCGRRLFGRRSLWTGLRPRAASLVRVQRTAVLETP